ncbi:FDLD family class I lanthipeptide [Streptomyces sp. NPDC090445]|uniref:FDLD family class I lanthipeptide n=1 Tax=Streptomyces sp. NPDC090445 TaxID=3365963 RepID=UPI0038190C06
MSISLMEPVVQDSVLDDFDLDVRITVSADFETAEAGFSNWYSCKGTCVRECLGVSVNRCK